MNRLPNAGGPVGLIAIVLAIAICSSIVKSQSIFPQPPPGSVYRDFSRVMYGSEPRVTTIEAANNYPSRVYHPVTNPNGDIVLPTPWLYIDGIQTANAVKAELIITMWGGHIGTFPKWFYVNGDTTTRFLIPEVLNTPTDPQCYGSFYNAVVEIPTWRLSGSTSIRGDAGTQTCWWFGWPQWLWYGVIMRVYYDPNQVLHPGGEITSPGTGGTFGDNPTVTVSTAGGGVAANRVDVIAYYDGYDVDGDGVFREYQLDYHAVTMTYEMDISNHVGTATGSGPTFQIPWTTTWVPNQDPGSVKLMARVRGTNGVWYVTPEVTGLTFARQNGTVRLFKPKNTPEHFWARDAVWVGNESDVTTLANASQALLLVRTWNGYDGRHNDPNPSPPITQVNGNNVGGRYGRDHAYSFDILDVQTSYLTTGTNTIRFWADSKNDHGVEVMWPGPALMVRYGSVVPTTPATPALAQPANGASGVSLNPDLVWNSVDNADSYKLQLATDAGFSTLVVDLAGLTDTVRQVGPLAAQTLYYWHVRGTNSVGDGSWSATRSFTTLGTPAAPVLVAPANNATNQATALTLSWRPSSGATGYTLQVGTDQSFTTGIVLVDSLLADTSRAVTGLATSTAYYWRVRAKNAAGSGTFSSAWKFTTLDPAPATPTLVSPANNALNQASSLDFTWNAVAGAVTYNLQLGTDSTFSGGIVKNDTTITTTSRNVVGLLSETRYFWRVRAKNATTYGGFSPTWTFRTGTGVSVERNDGLPSSTTLVQNYPNPFNPTTTIQFGLPAQAHATLEIFNVAGEKVATLVDADMPAGYYSVRFDAGRLPSAMYLYRLTAGGERMVRRMVLAK